MRTNISMESSTYLRLLLLVPAVGLLGIAGCTTAGGTAKQSHAGGYVHIAASTYNTESRSFDRPWPFGPESSQQ